MEGSPSRPARIIIVDDHPLFASALKMLIVDQPDVEVVAEAADGRVALNLCRNLKPDLVLMDLNMPKVNGIEATRMIKRELPQTIVLIMTASAEPGDLAKAVKAGAGGYVLKTAPPHRIIDAIRRALDGEAPLNQELAMQLLMRLMDEEQEQHIGAASEDTQVVEKQRASPLTSVLSVREVEVLRQLAQGHTNEQIAQHLFISVSTVKKHVRQIISKLGVSDRTHAAILAIKHGLSSEQDV
jgi:DNA-binding NarL/FixJ family response regulator